MRKTLLAVASVAALFAAAPALAQDAEAGAAAQAQSGVSETEIQAYAKAMNGLQPILQGLNGASPSAEQQTQMAAVVTEAGLTAERFNAIAGAAQSDDVLAAQIAVARAPAPTGAAASVTDAEIEAYAKAMAGLGPIIQGLNGAAPTAEQQAEMAAVVTAAGLSPERFNAIGGLSSDASVRARLQLATARAGS